MGTHLPDRQRLLFAFAALIAVVMFGGAGHLATAQKAVKQAVAKKEHTDAWKSRLRITGLQPTSYTESHGVGTVAFGLTVANLTNTSEPYSISLYPSGAHALVKKIGSGEGILTTATASSLKFNAHLVPGKSYLLLISYGPKKQYRFHGRLDVIRHETRHGDLRFSLNFHSSQTPVIDTFVDDYTPTPGCATDSACGAVVGGKPKHMHVFGQSSDAWAGPALSEGASMVRFKIEVWQDYDAGNDPTDLYVTLYARSGTSPNFTYTAMSPPVQINNQQCSEYGEINLPDASGGPTYFYPTIDLKQGSTMLATSPGTYAIGVVRVIDDPADEIHANFSVSP